MKLAFYINGFSRWIQQTRGKAESRRSPVLDDRNDANRPEVATGSDGIGELEVKGIGELEVKEEWRMG